MSRDLSAPGTIHYLRPAALTLRPRRPRSARASRSGILHASPSLRWLSQFRARGKITPLRFVSGEALPRQRELPSREKRSRRPQVFFPPPGAALCISPVYRPHPPAPVSPVIISQGDHGSGLLLDWNSSEETCLRERTSILNAYYIPTGKDGQLYDSIMPVNSFRVVLNEVFALQLPLLDDRSYFSTWDLPYQVENVTDRIEATCTGK